MLRTRIATPSVKLVKPQPKSLSRQSSRSYQTKQVASSSSSFAQINTYNTRLTSSPIITKQPTRTFLGSFFGKKTGGPFQTIESGVDKSIIEAGDGKNFPQKGQTVVIDYVAYANGKKFDASSDANGDSFRFVVGYGQVIKGWDVGVSSMSLGERAILKIAPEMGYGEHEFLGIPANSSLELEVHLLNILPPHDQTATRQALAERFPKIYAKPT